MRREISEKVELKGCEAEISEDEIKIIKNGKETRRKYYGFDVKKENDCLILENKKSTKKNKKLIKTIAAHLRNIVDGMDNNYVYKLQICSVHFPMTAAVDKAKQELVVKNFLGGVKPRIAKILPGVNVKVEKEIIIVEGHDKEKAGQTAANIEQATRISNKDRRVFQDGIHMIEKPNEKIYG